MTLEEFRATRQPCSDEMWAEIQEAYTPEDMPTRETVFQYADGFIIHEADGQFFPHAWWYAAVARDTRAAAEESLHKWRAEFFD